ncbi:hybrid sensor histidine kinase/response regulator [Mongoliitalea daihaiensis]|uniref:hybrid sensor histidine kinase/response regulator n=1 Tax=Mongoliitalea daihaiensis TaxID=2782006 RepID=UPI001F44F9CF|nr:hybrid sensor histidine kinase/response regulator [Mongoliitalea daihaiensis]UJP66215.1 response regulator [Mongoliitalea daihaiensis]
MNNLVTLVCLIVATSNLQAQFLVETDNFHKPISIYEAASITNVGSEILSLQQFLEKKATYTFEPIAGPNTNLGFTKDNYWLKFSLTNNSNRDLSLFFETGRPITDIIELYQIDASGTIVSQITGDLLPFDSKPLAHRKMIFPIELKADSSYEFYVQYQSDGEVINLPLNLHSANSMILTSYKDQLAFGIFYGILVLAGAIYLFFYFGIKEKSFLLYFIYVSSIALLHLSLDGYFFQYLTPSAGWLSRNAVLLAAAFSALAFGRYVQVFMKVKNFSPLLEKVYNSLHICILALIGAILFIHSAIEFYYPLVNLLGVLLLFLIIGTLVTSLRRGAAPDLFFGIGLFFFFSGFFIFILNNFSLIPNSFITENASKFGTGLEIIFLSLSMANRIRILKSEKEQMQEIALQRSQESNEIKSFFLSNISHELRTPLNAVIGLSKSIQETTQDPKVKSDLEIIQYSSLELLSAINDILDYSNIEKKELKLEERPVKVEKIIQELRTITANKAKDKNLNFIYEEINQLPAYILGDKARIRQILLNILNNAIKFTQKGDVKLSIQSDLSPRNTVDLTITITDTGVGIEQEKLDRIYESFIQEQIDDKRKFGGFGLGLCIVKALIELYQGTINITSTKGKGTKVVMQLNFKLPEKKAAQATSSISGTYDLQGKHILIVEDNPVNQVVMKAILRKWQNTTFDIANNGIEALEKLQAAHVDLILMDLQMPEMDGYEATVAIRNGEAGSKNQQIPIIAVTADATDKAKEKVKAVGMDDYMTKPVDKDELYSKVQQCLYLQEVDVSNIL